MCFEYSVQFINVIIVAAGPVCQYCNKHLLEPTARICAKCGHLHRASVSVVPKDDLNCQKTNPMDIEIDSIPQFKYPHIFGPNLPTTSAVSSPLTRPALSSYESKENESAKTDSQFTRERDGKGSPSSADSLKSISAATIIKIGDILKKNPRKRKSHSNVSSDKFCIKHFKPDDDNTLCVSTDPSSSISDDSKKSSQSPGTGKDSVSPDASRPSESSTDVQHDVRNAKYTLINYN